MSLVQQRFANVSQLSRRPSAQADWTDLEPPFDGDEPDWDECEPEPAADEEWDPFEDEEEPEPAYGDFWPEQDDFDD